MKKEKDFGTMLRHYITAFPEKFPMSCTFETKDTLGSDSISFSKVEQPQVDHAMAVRWGDKGCLIRVQAGNIGAPDYAFYKNAPAFIVIKYPKMFCFIDIDTFLLEKEKSARKSLTGNRARQISIIVVELK